MSKTRLFWDDEPEKESEDDEIYLISNFGHDISDKLDSPSPKTKDISWEIAGYKVYNTEEIDFGEVLEPVTISKVSLAGMVIELDEEQRIRKPGHPVFLPGELEIEIDIHE